MLKKVFAASVISFLLISNVPAHHDQNIYAKDGNGVLVYQSQNSLKHKRDYLTRRDSINALMTQYQNISVEKHLQADAEKLQQDILAYMKLAEHEASLLHYPESRAILEPAYRLIQQAIIAARNGEELIMSLNFATPKDEYEYYVLKIDSQFKAIGLFINQIAAERARNNIRRILNGANNEYAKAVELASAEAYAQALPLMDRVLNQLRSGLMMVVNQQR